MTKVDPSSSESQLAAGQALLDAIEPLHSGNLKPSELGYRLGGKMAFQGSSEFKTAPGSARLATTNMRLSSDVSERSGGKLASGSNAE